MINFYLKYLSLVFNFGPKIIFFAIFSISFVVSDIFGKLNIFSTQKCSFQQNLPDKSREDGKKHNFGPHIINNFSSLS